MLVRLPILRSNLMSFTVRRLREEQPSRRSLWKLAALWALRFAGPLMEVGHLWRAQQEKRRKEEKRVNLLKRVMIILVAIFCAFLLFAGTAKALLSLKIISLQNFVSMAGTPLPVDAYGHTNILLLGQGDESHDGVDLTDTIMIASIDPTETRSVVLLSLPRDLYFLDTQKMGEGRINSLYRDYKAALQREGLSTDDASMQAMRELADEIGRAMDTEIHHVVKVDFIGFVQAVDAIGGINIVVPETLVDTEYPGPNYTYETFMIEAGPQHIDGETALKYARSRHSTSDFARSARQQQIIAAIANRVKTEGILTRPGQIADLLDIMENHVATTLQLRDMVSLAGLGESIDRTRIVSMQLNTQNGLYGSFSEPGGLLYTPPRDQFGGASVLLPVSIPEFPVTWERLRLLTHLAMHERTAHVEKTPVLIFNAGASPGSARRLGGELIRFGFNVTAMENAPDGVDLPSSRLTAEADNQTALLLRPLLGMELNALPPAPASSSAAGEPQPAPVSIELGEEYIYAPLQPSEPTSAPQQE